MSNPIDSKAPQTYSLEELTKNSQGYKTTGAALSAPALKVQDAAKSLKNESKGISETSAQEYNGIYGDSQGEERVLNEYLEMRKLGGLDGADKPSMKNIRTARLGFAVLAGNRNPEICLPALRSLQTLIEQDPITSDSSADLIPLVKIFLNQMDKKIQEEKSKEVRIEFVKTFAAIAELILNHNASDHLGKITEDLKLKLDGALDGLSRLNSKKDLHLTFQIKCAREGIKRFKDDSQIVFDILRRIFHLSMAAAAYFYTDIMLPDELKKTFCNTHIKVHLKESWYEEVLFIKQLTKTILAEPSNLTEEQKASMVKSLLAYINFSQNEARQKWPFYYAAVELLTQIALKSNSRLLRNYALEGCAVKYVDPKTDGIKKKELKGLAAAADFQGYLLKKRSLNPGTAKYQCVDYNAEIRMICAENLIKMANQSKDSYIRERAKNLLITRLTIEESSKVQYLLASNIPSDPKKQLEWIEEKATLKNARPKSSGRKVAKKHSSQRHSISAIDNKNQSSSKNRKKKEPAFSNSLPLSSHDDSFSSSEDFFKGKEKENSTESSKEENIHLTFKQEMDKNILYYSSKLEALKSDPQAGKEREISKAFLRRGVCYLFENQVIKGKEDLKSAYKIDPTCFKAAFELAKLHAELKETEKVQKWALRALAIQPEHRGAQRLAHLAGTPAGSL